MRRACLESLADALSKVVPSGTTVEVGNADWEEPACLPLVRVIPQRFDFEPWQEEERDDTQPTRLFLDVGTFSGTVELRAAAKSKREREELEDLILNWFLSRELSPGVQVTVIPSGLKVGGAVTTYQAPCSFEMSGSEWQEEMAFQNRRYSFIDVDAHFPALVMREPVYTIDQLILALDSDDNGTVDFETIVTEEG